MDVNSFVQGLLWAGYAFCIIHMMMKDNAAANKREFETKKAERKCREMIKLRESNWE